MKNAWIEHLKQTKKEQPELSYRERVKLAQETYKKKEKEKTITGYITREEFDKFTKYDSICSLLLLGLIFVIPVSYSITANTKNYLGFYAMVIMGLFCIAYSYIKYFQWRKKK